MLGYISDIIVKIMQNVTTNDILEGRVRYDRISLSEIKKICYAVDKDVNESTLEKRLESLSVWVRAQLKEDGYRVETEGDGESFFSLFDLVYCLTSLILKTRHGEIVYRYEYLKPWHNLIGKIGSNFVVSCAYAALDYRNPGSEPSFLWKEILDHDNHALNHILNKKMSENHYHLRCSTPYFILSWLSMMNSVKTFRFVDKLDHMDRNLRNPKVHYTRSFDNDRFVIKHLKAALIRLYLFSFLTEQRIVLDDYRADVLWVLENIIPESVWKWLNDSFPLSTVQGDPKEKLLTDCMEKAGMDRAVMQEKCPAFYWFFWKRFANIPADVLKDKGTILSKNNLAAIAEYAERNYEPLLLEECGRYFDEKNRSVFLKEWDRQTVRSLETLLREPDELSGARNRIQYMIDTFQNHTARGYKDYAMTEVPPWDESEWERAIMSGERWLIYKMMHRRFYYRKGDKGQEDRIYNLFFAYLVIKESFRMELLQTNDRPGFENFQKYQKRKDWFTTGFSEGELARIAVRETLNRQNLKSLELRISPQNSSADNIRMIRRYDADINHDHKWSRNGKKKDRFPYYYVFHFGKQKDNAVRSYQHDYENYCRHYAYRRRMKQKAYAILHMREKNPDIAMRLRGIDACSSEDGCRPEVFAVAFRVLKHHLVYRTDMEKQLFQLRVSYHVGEENQDVLDGLRAINEAVFFLNLDSNDRIGHATMLGVDVWSWYQQNNFKISCRQHDYLDNVAWLHNMIITYHISNQDNLLEYLESQYQIYFGRIYIETGGINAQTNKRILERRNIERSIRNMGAEDDPDADVTLDFNIYNYFHAWELRGDDPGLYEKGFYDRGILGGDIWENYRVNKRTNMAIRSIPEAAILYYTYQYNINVRNAGENPVVIEIPYHMVRGIELVQKELQKEIAKRGIAIETNPSSNVMISRLFDYGHHPIVSFYNKGLTYDTEELDHCPQLNVSINTDDLGVFTTCLYNEYTLMAYELENLKDEDGHAVYRRDMVYDWINNVRKMGNSQSFLEKRK